VAKNIVVVGMGYVGCSLAVLLAPEHRVTAIDIDKAKITKLSQGISPIDDKDIARQLRSKKLQLNATTEPAKALSQADVVIIATPTNYDIATNRFDTQGVEAVIDQALKASSSSLIVIKSTIPIGFTTEQNNKRQTKRIIFSPEFLREGRALYDNLNPSRIIAGGEPKRVKQFTTLLQKAALNSPKVLRMGATEAEAVKLFANNYLAIRIAFFNELDTYAEAHGLDSAPIVHGVSADPRIGDYYNNPSFGYGGYCLPKDTKQLAAQFLDIPGTLIDAVVASNSERQRHIVAQILKLRPKTVGIYRLVMKVGSENFRQSAIWNIIEELEKQNIEVVIYEPLISNKFVLKYEVINDFTDFTNRVDNIVANRHDATLAPFAHKVYTRDIYNRD